MSFADAEGAFYSPLAMHREDPDAEGEERLVAMGSGSAGQTLAVVYTLRGDDIRIISARRATRGEVREYEGGIPLFRSRAGCAAFQPGEDPHYKFRARAEQAGTGYQTMMSEALKGYLAIAEAPVTESVLRRVRSRTIRGLYSCP